MQLGRRRLSRSINHAVPERTTVIALADDREGLEDCCLVGGRASERYGIAGRSVQFQPAECHGRARDSRFELRESHGGSSDLG